MFKKLLVTVGLLALCASAPMTAHAAVYVEDVHGSVQEYDTVPELPMPESAHVEYAMGVVTSDNGDGVIIHSTDGVTAPYTYIAYRPIPVAVGDVVQTMFVYHGEDMLWRIDITPEL